MLQNKNMLPVAIQLMQSLFNTPSLLSQRQDHIGKSLGSSSSSDPTNMPSFLQTLLLLSKDAVSTSTTNTLRFGSGHNNDNEHDSGQNEEDYNL